MYVFAFAIRESLQFHSNLLLLLINVLQCIREQLREREVSRSRSGRSRDRRRQTGSNAR